MHTDTTNPTPTQTTEPTRVVHVKDDVPGAVYIGRAMPRQGLKASKWANPWKIGPDCDRETAIGMYENYMREKLIGDLPELRGKPLACWCVHDGDPPLGDDVAWRCHGDVLVWWLETFTDDEMRRWGGQP